jgi:hypothetical protein
MKRNRVIEDDADVIGYLQKRLNRAQVLKVVGALPLAGTPASPASGHETERLGEPLRAAALTIRRLPATCHAP